MTTKLTLSINKETVQRAKRISRKRGKSISRMVEEYFKSIPEKSEQEENIIDNIKQITKNKITNPNLDWKEIKQERLSKSMAYKVFLDTNVFLDIFLERTSDWQDAASLLQLAAANRLDAYTSPNNLINVIYLLHKQKLTASEVIGLVELALTCINLSETTKYDFQQALRAGFSDLEDAIQSYTAMHIKGIDYFITSNIKGHKQATSHLPVLSPKQL